MECGGGAELGEGAYVWAASAFEKAKATLNVAAPE